MGTVLICLLSLISILFGAYYGFMVVIGSIASLSIYRKIMWTKVLMFPFGRGL